MKEPEFNARKGYEVGEGHDMLNEFAHGLDNDTGSAEATGFSDMAKMHDDLIATAGAVGRCHLEELGCGGGGGECLCERLTDDATSIRVGGLSFERLRVAAVAIAADHGGGLTLRSGVC